MEDIQPQPPLPAEPEGPRVTVLIVCYNRAAALRRCLDALMKSNGHERLQVIVLDTGSHDGSSSAGSDFPDVTFLRMPRNFGSTKALNIGMRSAKAELILFLDPAVEVAPDTVDRLIAALEETPDAGAVCPLLVDPAGQVLPQVRQLPGRDVLGKLWREPDALPASVPSRGEPLVANEYGGRKAILIRRTFLRGMNYFDERYGDYGNDLELAFQIRHASRKTFIVTGAAATDHSSAEPQPNWSNSQRATIAADRFNGIANFLSRRAGFVAGLLLRISAVLTTLLKAITFQNPGYSWNLLVSLLTGSKIDGSQSSL